MASIVQSMHTSYGFLWFDVLSECDGFEVDGFEQDGNKTGLLTPYLRTYSTSACLKWLPLTVKGRTRKLTNASSIVATGTHTHTAFSRYTGGVQARLLFLES